MDLADLRIFRAVVDAGGICRAAERLHRVPSNVTTRVKQLEQELGVDLFIRSRRQLRLSSAGETLMVYADQLLALAERARAAVLDDTPRGILRLGAMESTSAVRLPSLLSEYQSRYADVTIELQTGSPPELRQRVIAGQLDAAFVTEPVEDPRLETRDAFVEELVIVTSARHPAIASPQDVVGGSVLAFHPGCPHRERLERWFFQGKVPIARLIEMTSYHAMLGCAVVGMGAALMPRSVLETFRDRDRLAIYSPGPGLNSARTLLVSRRGERRANVAALADLLEPRRAEAAA